MSDISDLTELREQRRRYRRSVHDAARMLRDFQTRLHDATVGVALAGRLGAILSDEPIGAVTRIDADVLLGLGDDRVSALVRVDQAIDVAVTALYSQPMAK